MPSFAFHPINRITRSISSPNTLASQNQTKVVSVITATRSRNGNTTSRSDLTPEQLTHSSHSSDSDSFTTPTSSQPQHSQPTHPYPVAMPRLNPLHFISAVTSTRSSHLTSESDKPPSPVSLSSASSARDSLPIPSSFSRSSSYNGPAPSRHHIHKVYSDDQSIQAVTDLPPVSPISSMYDPRSSDISPDGSRLSDEDSGTSAPLSSSSASDYLDDNVFLRPRSTRENRLQSNEVRGPVVNGNGHSRLQNRDIGPSVSSRRAMFERPSSPVPSPNPAAFALHTRESVFAGIAARGKVVDAFVANRHVPDITKSDDTCQSVPEMPRVMSGNLEIPRGKVEQLPVPRPVTPCQVPRPETPSRLPRPRVFIKPSPSRHSVVDPVAVTRVSEMGPGEAEFVTREISRPVTPSPVRTQVITEPPISSTKDRSFQEDFYFSDEEHVEDEASDYRLDQYTGGAPTPSDMLTYKVRRAVSALRSLSFQSHNPDDLETAWGQANAMDPVRERNNVSAASSRWRRACGRISSKNGVQEYDCRSEADAHSVTSYNSNLSTQRYRGVTSREQLRDFVGVPLRADHGSRQRRSLWTGGKRDRQHAPQTRAAELLLSNGQGLLAASADAYDNSNALTTVSPAEHIDVCDHPRSNGRRCSVDKYVEFIHASAQREARNRNQYSTLRSRIVNRMFRRRWK